MSGKTSAIFIDIFGHWDIIKSEQKSVSSRYLIFEVSSILIPPTTNSFWVGLFHTTVKLKIRMSGLKQIFLHSVRTDMQWQYVFDSIANMYILFSIFRDRGWWIHDKNTMWTLCTLILSTIYLLKNEYRHHLELWISKPFFPRNAPPILLFSYDVV